MVGTFDNGESRNLYQIPLALFANVNGLTAGSNGVFEISRESGELLLKAAGVGGAGNTLGGVLVHLILIQLLDYCLFKS